LDGPRKRFSALVVCRTARKTKMNEDYLSEFPVKLKSQDKKMKTQKKDNEGLLALTAQLDKHEAVCKERYEQINARLKRLERIVMGTAGATILLLVGLLVR